jgi:sugar lactone lactonase YvrE
MTANLNYSNTTVTLSIEASPDAFCLSCPAGIAIDCNDNIYVTDSNDNAIYRITQDGIVTTLASDTGVSGTIDANGINARFNCPTGIAIDCNDNMYVADSNNHTIRKISMDGIVTTLAGQAGSYGSNDANNNDALFNFPTGIAADCNDNIYVADSNNNTVRWITSNDFVITLAGQAGIYGSIDANGTDACFNYPTGIAIDCNDNIYIADSNNHTIRRISIDNIVTTFAGEPNMSGSIDANNIEARFNYPLGIVIDCNDNIYVADSNNHTIRQITPAGVVTTFAGQATIAGLKDGTGTEALFNKPSAIAFDSSGNLFIVDTGNASLRKITPEGVVTTLSLKSN